MAGEQSCYPRAVDHGKRAGWQYLVACLITPPLLLAFILFLSGTEWFSRHDNYPALRNVGYGVRLRGADCEIVLYGDSSALTGLDPQIISSRTGLTACNVSEGLTIQEVVGSDAPLRNYLRHNKPPRVILGMWSYTSLRPDIPPLSEYTTEGMVYAARYSSWPRLLFRRPEWGLRFAGWAIENLAHGVYAAVLKAPDRHPDAQKVRERRGGIFPYPLNPEVTCVRNGLQEGEERIRAWPDSVAAFRARYTSPQTAVIVDISPIPSCNKFLNVYRTRNEGLHDNRLMAVPIAYFNEGDVHFSPEGSRALSEHVADQITAALSRH